MPARPLLRALLADSREVGLERRGGASLLFAGGPLQFVPSSVALLVSLLNDLINLISHKCVFAGWLVAGASLPREARMLHPAGARASQS